MSLKKYLNNLTLTVIYLENKLRFHVLPNISEEIKAILSDFIPKHEGKTPDLRW